MALPHEHRQVRHALRVIFVATQGHGAQRTPGVFEDVRNGTLGRRTHRQRKRFAIAASYYSTWAATRRHWIATTVRLTFNRNMLTPS